MPANTTLYFRLASTKWLSIMNHMLSNALIFPDYSIYGPKYRKLYTIPNFTYNKDLL